jgi:dipeptidase
MCSELAAALLTSLSSEATLNSAAALAADPYAAEGGVGEDAIPSLLLPQARSARAAAALLGSLVERLGAAEGFGLLAADAREAWYLETASGHHWAAQRVPDACFFVHFGGRGWPWVWVLC